MKIIKSLFLLTIVIFWTAKPLFAATATGTPTTYEITVNRVRFYNSGTAEWVTVGEGDMAFDIAAINAGAMAGSYASGASFTPGTYTQVEVKIYKDIKITASGSLGGTTYYTTATAQSGAITTNATGPAVKGTATIPAALLTGDYFIDTQNLSSSIVIKKGLTKTAKVKFNVTNAATFDNSSGPVICYPTAPSVTYETVD